MVRNRFDFHTVDLKQDRNRTQGWMEGEIPEKKIPCSICGSMLYECLETAESHFMACHGHVKINGKVQPCPNNIDEFDPKIHWKPKPDQIRANWHKHFVSEASLERFALTRQIGGRKVA